MRVALKDIKGVNTVDVSLSKGEAVVTFDAGNSVRYAQLLRAIEKNGFVAKGATLTADGMLTMAGTQLTLEISGSNERMVLEPQSGVAGAAKATLLGKPVEVTGEVPEAAKGKAAEAMRFSSLRAK